MTDENGISRRTFVRGAGVAAGAAVVGGGSMAVDGGPVQEADAIAPVVLYGAGVLGATAVSVALGWALREYEVVGQNPPPEGLTADALTEQIHSTTTARLSNNKSTFIDNQNIVAGIEHAAYADGKVAAIDALNSQVTQSEVQTAALDVVKPYEITVKKNLLKSWNESLLEMESLYSAASSHSDLNAPDLIRGTGNTMFTVGSSPGTQSVDLTGDGDTFDVLTVIQDTGSTAGAYEWNPVEKYANYSDGQYTGWCVVVHDPAAGEEHLRYLAFDGWNPVYSAVDTAFTNVKDGLALWVDSVYSSVQAGELDTEELLTPRELAAMTTDDETYNQAVTDLMALNISVNLEREAEIRLPDIGATLYGSLSVTGDTTLSPGTIDPSTDSLSYYFTYDVASGEGTWEAFNAGVDGGTVTFTEEPFPSSSFLIETTAGESAEATTTDFVDNGDGTYTVDISDQLETKITEVSSVNYYAESTETNYETVQLTSPFEIVTFRDSEGTEVESADYTSNEPQDDTNYVTEAEWKAQEERFQELIDEYEESQSGGAGLAGLFGGDGGGIAVLGLAAAAGAILFGGRR